MPYENAYAARVSDDNVVLEVIVIPYMDDDDEKITAYCNGIGLPGRWLDTSYLGSRRGKYAAGGMVYNPDLDAFHEVQPFPSWTLNESYDWEAPVPCPGLRKDHRWDEQAGQWKPI